MLLRLTGSYFFSVTGYGLQASFTALMIYHQNFQENYVQLHYKYTKFCDSNQLHRVPRFFQKIVYIISSVTLSKDEFRSKFLSSETMYLLQ